MSLRRTKSDQVNGRPLVALPKKTIRMKRLDFTTEERQVYDMFFAKGPFKNDVSYIFAFLDPFPLGSTKST